MKIAEITDETLLNYLRLTERDAFLQVACDAAKAFILSYTGMSEKEINKHDDLTAAYLVLVSDFYDNRQYVNDRDYSNLAVKTILSAHRKNLLPGK